MHMVLYDKIKASYVFFCMSFFTRKKLLLIGFLTILLLGIPTTVFLLQQQQDTRSRAQKSTTLSFVPVSSETAPIQKRVGDTFPLEININPGVNSVSYVKMEIQYDPTKIATADANAFQPNLSTFPTIIEGPIYTPGKVSVTLSIGIDITKAVTQPTRAATINFRALATTVTAPTLITYGNSTEVLSIGSTDQASENVLSTTSPAYVTIAASGGTGTPTPSPTTGPITPIPTPLVVTDPNPTATPVPVTNQSPVCASLTLDKAASGVAPYALGFTATGSDSDGTITKVTYNFGDGSVVDVKDAGGIGSNSVSVQTSHTYTVAGTYQVAAVLTDNNGGISLQSTCTQTVTVTASSTSSGTAEATVQPTAQPPVTIAPTGPGDMFLGMGAVIAVLTIVGSFIFFSF